jgi:phospholipid/cholesterol/gamma-HCH transport system substrate-binding protein
VPTRYERVVAARALSIGLLLIAVVVVVIVVRGCGASYVIDAQFRDAGQLVPGDQVQLGGHSVGSVARISITPDGLADVRLQITDPSLNPLHLGTIATIGSPGLSGVANRYVRLDPGPAAAPAIPDGGVLGPDQTRGIVDLDMLIDSLDKPSRTRLHEILRESADVLASPAGSQTNAALALLNPALSQTAALGSELVSDQAALSQLIRSTADVSSTLAARRSDLGQSVTNTAAVLRDIAAQRLAFSDLLRGTPAVLRQASGVLARTRPVLEAVDPVVRHLQPVALVAAGLLRQILPVARNAVPAIAAIRRLLPQASSTLAAFPSIASTTVPALQSATAAFIGLLPMITGLRPYAPDLIGGFFEGFGGNASGYYDANGHYARIEVNTGPGSTPGVPAAPSSGYRTGLVARCPGGASAPAPDGSNPFIPPDVKNLCNPANDPSP